jgi:hypothetical protein
MTGVRPSAGTSRERDEDLRDTAKAATTDQHISLDEPAIHEYTLVAGNARLFCAATPHDFRCAAITIGLRERADKVLLS